MNILIYKGQFVYDVGNLFIDNTIYFLQKKGHNVIVVDLTKPYAMNKIIGTFSEKSIDFVIAFNGIGVDIKLNNGQYIYDEVNTTFLAIYLDHPAHHILRLSENVRNYVCSFLDKSHVDYVDEVLPNYHKIKFFLPHAGLSKTIEEENSIKTFETYKKEKSFDVVFSGTYQGNITKKWYESGISPYFPKYILDEVCNQLIHDDYSSIHETFKNVCQKYSIKFSNIAKAQLSKIFTDIISYIRSFKRVELIKKIAQSGLDITICGSGWENFAKEYKNVNYVGALNIQENLDLIKKAKVLVNVTPNFTKGSHERVFTGMLNNAVLFTDKSSYYDEYFEDGTNILYYSFNSLDKDIERLKKLLKDDKKLYEMSQSAYKISREYHTWENRVGKILEMIEFSKFMDK